MSLCGLSYESPQSEALGSMCIPKGNLFQGDDLLRYAYMGVACFRKNQNCFSESTCIPQITNAIPHAPIEILSSKPDLLSVPSLSKNDCMLPGMSINQTVLFYIHIILKSVYFITNSIDASIVALLHQ